LTADPNTSQERISSALQAGPSDGATPPSTAVEARADHPEDQRYRGLDLWLHRITVLLFVFLCAVVGVLLMIFPWRPEWTDNRLFLAYPGLRAFMANGFVRGVCSGLGLLDIWVGFWEAIHYHEGKQA